MTGALRGARSFSSHAGSFLVPQPQAGNNPLDNSRLNDYILGMMQPAQKKTAQRRPFRRVEDEAFVNIQRTADALMQGVAATLKPMGLSPTQYNVLRILRGAEPDGLGCREIADRMIARDPDITRLLDRLEERGLVARSRHREDRRVITTRITEKGLRLLKELDEPVDRLHMEQLGHLGDQKLRSLIQLLEAARTGPE